MFCSSYDDAITIATCWWHVIPPWRPGESQRSLRLHLTSSLMIINCVVNKSFHVTIISPIEGGGGSDAADADLESKFKKSGVIELTFKVLE